MSAEPSTTMTNPFRKRTLWLLTAILSYTIAVAQEHHRLTNLPHLYINTFSGQDVTSKETQVLAKLWLVDEQDQVAFYDSVNIRGRGNATWNLKKKPYRIKFAQKTRLLGDNHANAKKWTLLANHGDKSLIRNALASYIGDLCGQPFTPAAQFVDLTLNGEYRGTYQISDQIEVRKHRVDIEKQDFPLTEESNITGGYLLEADGTIDFNAGYTGFWTTRGVPVNIHYPDKDEIVNDQLAYIRDFVTLFEYRLFDLDFNSPEGYHHYVDSVSLASWYLASEITANIDYLWSMYFYKEQNDQRLHFGPLWDYDIAFDNDRRMQEMGNDPRRQLMADIGFTNVGTGEWIKRMWQDPWFQQMILQQYVKLYANGLETKLLNKVDSLSQLLQQSQQLNYQCWDIDQRTQTEVVIFSTYEEYIDDLKQFIQVRVPSLLQAFSQLQSEPVDIDSLIEAAPIRSIKADDIDYALAYNRQNLSLHFGTTDISDLDFTAHIYNEAGRQVLSFPANKRVSVEPLPSGLYIVTWEHQGRQRSAKFVR